MAQDGTDPIVAEAFRLQREREKGYRERALKIFPHICARCGREFSGKRVKELTVHHKDHNHDNNPADGGNWELLCLYCHENEHGRVAVADSYAGEGPGKSRVGTAGAPLGSLGDLLKAKLKK